jgi:ParB family transcriptional regulator, chromosome partitioning protein
MASRTDKLKERLGAHMAESMGAGAGGSLPEVAASPGSGSPGGVASKQDGVKPLREARSIRLENLVRDPAQPRQVFAAESLNRLAKSLLSRGQLQPIRVRWNQEQGKYLILVGERRWRAAMLAGMESLQAVVVERELSPSEILQEQLVENCLREDLQPIEQAQAFRVLMGTNGWSARKVAEELNMANSTVVKALALLELAPAVQEQVEAGTLAPAVAYEVSKLEKPEDQVEVAGRVVAEKLTRDQAAEVVREKSGRPAKTRSAATRGMGTAPQGAGRAEYRLDDGTIVSVAGPAVGSGPDAVIVALELALDRARKERGQEQAA